MQFSITKGAIGGFGPGLIASGGDFKAGLVGGLTGAGFGWVGGTELSLAKRAFAHGAVGGVSSELSGGKFSSGFINSAFAKAATPAVSNAIGDNVIAKTVVMATVAGTASELAGGKFGNGAMSGAFAYLYNELSKTPKIIVEAGFTKAPFGANHGLVIGTDLITGKSFAIRGGPVGLVQMSAKTGFFNEGFADTPAEVHTHQYIGEISMSLEEFSSRLDNFASKVNNNYVPYNALDHNSNSLAATSIKMLGFTIPEPAVFAPGWGRELTFYSDPVEYRIERHGWLR